MDNVIETSEPIARFVRSQSHMRPGLGKPKFLAFMPRVANGEISVYRTAGLTSTEIQALGAEYVATLTSPIKGHCVQVAGDFFIEGLNIESTPHPHFRHANVRGWATDPKNRITAQKLADKAALTIY